jgi:hypothetical protein
MERKNKMNLRDHKRRLKAIQKREEAKRENYYFVGIGALVHLATTWVRCCVVLLQGSEIIVNRRCAKPKASVFNATIPVHTPATMSHYKARCN